MQVTEAVVLSQVSWVNKGKSTSVSSLSRGCQTFVSVLHGVDVENVWPDSSGNLCRIGSFTGNHDEVLSSTEHVQQPDVSDGSGDLADLPGLHLS